MALNPSRLFLGLGLWVTLGGSLNTLRLISPIGGLGLWMGGGLLSFGLGFWRWYKNPLDYLGIFLLVFPISVWAWLDAFYTYNGEHHGKILPMTVMIAMGLGGWLARWQGANPEAQAQMGQEAACGMVAATYSLAALAKLWGSGGQWFLPDALGMLILERSVGAPAGLAELRLMVASHPTVCSFFAVGSIFIEAAGILFLWAPARRPLAFLLLALHTGIAVLMGYVYLEWVCVVIGLAYSPGQRRGSG